VNSLQLNSLNAQQSIYETELIVAPWVYCLYLIVLQMGAKAKYVISVEETSKSCVWHGRSGVFTQPCQKGQSGWRLRQDPRQSIASSHHEELA
jgi:hypothetical protein